MHKLCVSLCPRMSISSPMMQYLSLSRVALFLALIFPPGALSFGVVHQSTAAPKADPAEETFGHERRSAGGESSGRKLPLRRDVLRSIGAACSFGSPFIAHTRPSNADETVSVLRSKGCYRGSGDACDELADDNEFVRSLQKKSAENREMNDRVCLSKFFI